jgi:hypothetical protein
MAHKSSSAGMPAARPRSELQKPDATREPTIPRRPAAALTQAATCAISCSLDCRTVPIRPPPARVAPPRPPAEPSCPCRALSHTWWLLERQSWRVLAAGSTLCGDLVGLGGCGCGMKCLGFCLEFIKLLGKVGAWQGCRECWLMGEMSLLLLRRACCGLRAAPAAAHTPR